MLQKKITITELRELHRKYSTGDGVNFTSYLCFMIQWEYGEELDGGTIQTTLQNFFSKYFKFIQKYKLYSTLPTWAVHWVEDYNEQDKIVGRLYPIDGDEIIIFSGEGEIIRKRMIDYVFSVDPEAYFII